RHTILQGDWSSDVCSSDLRDRTGAPNTAPQYFFTRQIRRQRRGVQRNLWKNPIAIPSRSPRKSCRRSLFIPPKTITSGIWKSARSEERRVGKERRRRRCHA